MSDMYPHELLLARLRKVKIPWKKIIGGAALVSTVVFTITTTNLLLVTPSGVLEHPFRDFMISSSLLLGSAMVTQFSLFDGESIL